MNKDWLFEEIHMIAQAWKGANGGIYSIRGMCLELLEKLMLPRLAAERERCAAICDGWIAGYGHGNIQYTPPTEYATDAVQDIADAIRSGTDPRSKAKEPEASGGTARCASPEVRVGASGADLTTTSEHMDVTAGETALFTDGERIILANQLEMMAALHQLMRGFLAADPLTKERLSQRILATRAFTDTSAHISEVLQPEGKQ